MRDRYKTVSKIYNTLCRLYSFGAIPRCRESSFSGDIEDVKICFIGVGHGDEAIHAAKLGARVTVVDLSASMLGTLKRQSELTGSETKHPIRIVHDDVRTFLKGSEDSFNQVVANFFLNVFPLSDVEKMVTLIVDKLSMNGELIVGDFYLTRDKTNLTDLILQFFQTANWYLALTLFRVITTNAWHGIYDYDSVMHRQGLKFKNRKLFRVLGIPMYQSCRYRIDFETAHEPS